MAKTRGAKKKAPATSVEPGGSGAAKVDEAQAKKKNAAAGKELMDPSAKTAPGELVFVDEDNSGPHVAVVATLDQLPLKQGELADVKKELQRRPGCVPVMYVVCTWSLVPEKAVTKWEKGVHHGLDHTLMRRYYGDTEQRMWTRDNLECTMKFAHVLADAFSHARKAPAPPQQEQPVAGPSRAAAAPDDDEAEAAAEEEWPAAEAPPPPPAPQPIVATPAPPPPAPPPPPPPPATGPVAVVVREPGSIAGRLLGRLPLYDGGVPTAGEYDERIQAALRRAADGGRRELTSGDVYEEGVRLGLFTAAEGRQRSDEVTHIGLRLRANGGLFASTGKRKLPGAKGPARAFYSLALPALPAPVPPPAPAPSSSAPTAAPAHRPAPAAAITSPPAMVKLESRRRAAGAPAEEPPAKRRAAAAEEAEGEDEGAGLGPGRGPRSAGRGGGRAGPAAAAANPADVKRETLRTFPPGP